MKKKFDVAIIGASLAGSATALRLRQYGLSTLIIDTEHFPRRKACGEGLSVLGLKELDKLGLSQNYRELEHIPFFGFTFFEKDSCSTIKIKNQCAHGIGIQRNILDNFLIENLTNTNSIQAHLGEKFSISRDGDRGFRLASQSHEYYSHYLVLATGAQSNLPQQLGVPTHQSNKFRYGFSVNIKTQPTDELNQTVKILLDGDTQICATHVTSEMTNLSIMSSARLSERMQIHSQITQALEALSIHGKINSDILGASGIGKYRRDSYSNGIFTLGDAFLQLDPIGGMGMTHALTGARITADTLRRLFDSSKLNTQMTLFEHRQRMKQNYRMLKGYTQLSYFSLANPVGRNTFGKLKTGNMAQHVLMSMHKNSKLSYHPLDLFSSLLISFAGLL